MRQPDAPGASLTGEGVDPVLDAAMRWERIWRDAKSRAPARHHLPAWKALARAVLERSIPVTHVDDAVSAWLREESRYTRGHDPRNLAEHLDRWLDEAKQRGNLDAPDRAHGRRGLGYYRRAFAEKAACEDAEWAKKGGRT